MGLWVVRTALLATALALLSPLVELWDAPAGLLLLALLLPAPCLVALALLGRRDLADRARQGLTLARSIGIVHLVPLALLLHHQLRLAWPTSMRTVGALGGLALLQATLAICAGRLLRRWPPRVETGWTRAAVASAAGHVVLVAYVLLHLVMPGGDGHALSRRESAAVGDLRSLASAEMAYASGNGDLHGPIACLEAPATCLPGYPASAPKLLGPEFLQDTRRGYKFTFHPGPAATVEEIARAKAAAGSFRGFAYGAAPVAPGRSGVLAFCIDASGAVRVARDGILPSLREGRCPDDLPLRD